MFASTPTTQTIGNAIINYRGILQNIITESNHSDPKLILQSFLREYVVTDKHRFFAARLACQLDRPDADVLIVLNDYFAKAPLDKHSSFFAALAAYFYYYADYYQVDRDLFSENEYPALMHHLVFPLRSYEKHVSETFKKKLEFSTASLDTTTENFFAQLNQVIACDIADEHRSQVYQNLLGCLRKSPKQLAKILPFLLKIGILDEDKNFLLTAYIEEHGYLTNENLASIFQHDSDAINCLLKISLHESLSVRLEISRCLESLYEKATAKQQIEIVRFWLKQTDQRDSNNDIIESENYYGWYRILNHRLPETIQDGVYCWLIESVKSRTSHPVTLACLLSMSETEKYFNDEYYQLFVDALISDPQNLATNCILNINLRRLSEFQRKQLVPLYRQRITNTNCSSALNCLYHSPVDMACWQFMIHEHFRLLHDNHLIGHWEIENITCTDEQMLYASQYFLEKLMSQQISEIITACETINNFQHPSLRESIILQLLDLLYSPHEQVQLAATSALSYVKPNLHMERIAERLIQLARNGQSDFRLALAAVCTESTRGQIVALLQELAFGPRQDGNALLRLLDLKAPINQALIPKIFNQKTFTRYNCFPSFEQMVIPNELVHSATEHLLLLITQIDCTLSTKCACSFLLKLPILYDVEKVVLAIIERCNQVWGYQLSELTESLLSVLDRLDYLPANTCLPIAKSVIKLTQKKLQENMEDLSSALHCYDLVLPILTKCMQQASCAERCTILALLDSPDLTNLPLRSYVEKLKTTFMIPLLLSEEVRRKAALPYLPAEMWQKIRP